jgi:hypothetical protein
MEGLFVLILVIGSLGIYFLPSIIGHKKVNRGAIFALNFFLGWTLVGWVVALVWALTVEEPRRSVVEINVSREHGMLGYNQPVRSVSCQRCGSALGTGAQFCPSCGAVLWV